MRRNLESNLHQKIRGAVLVGQEGATRKQVAHGRSNPSGKSSVSPFSLKKFHTGSRWNLLNSDYTEIYRISLSQKIIEHEGWYNWSIGLLCAATPEEPYGSET